PAPSSSIRSRGMKNIIAGTAGHIDHGKTALVRALTGIDADRLEEEKRRGITIDLGFAHLQLTPELRLGFIDVPGHERFVKNMLAGVGGIDIVLFVIAADESIKPQTREHFDICRLLGIQRGIVVLNKADLVDPEILELAGQRTALNLADVDTADLERGMMLAEPGVFHSTREFDCALELLPSAKPLKHRAPVHFHAGSAEIEAEVRLFDAGAALRPGAKA